MRKIYKQATVEFIEFDKQDAILASVVVGDGDNAFSDEFDDLI